MNRVCSIFSQILGLFPRIEFQQIVSEHKGERHARGFTCWGQFVAMLFCQLAHAHSLREICQGLAACEGKLKHLGLTDSPRRVDPVLRQRTPAMGNLSGYVLQFAKPL